MSGSVGKIVLPISSTFDASGVTAAKSALRELQQGQGAAGGGGGGTRRSTGSGQNWDEREADHYFEATRTASEKYQFTIGRLTDLHKRGAISTDTFVRAQKKAAAELPRAPGLAERLGLKQAGQTVANQFGLGGITSAAGATGVVAGAAIAGGAVYALTQKLAGESIALRENARQLGVSTTYYAGLNVAARRTGVSLETVTEGLGQMRSLAGEALGGDIGASLMFRALGISRGELAAGYEDTAGLSRRVLGVARRPEQQASIFGNVAAAEGVEAANAGRAGPFTPTAGSAAALSSLGSGLWQGTQGFLGRSVMGWKWMLGGGNPQQQEDAAEKEEEAKRTGQLAALKAKQGRAALPELLAPQERAQEERLSSQGMFDQYGHDAGRYMRLRFAAIRSRQTAAEAPYLAPRELEERELRTWRDQADNGGFSTGRQANEAGIQIHERANASLRGVRSNRENLAADMETFSDRYRNADPNAAARFVNGKVELPANLVKEQTDLARGFGDRLTDYAEGITKSGPLAGANDVNSVAGYSQQVQAEYGMQQSANTLRMIDLLLQIATNTGQMTAGQAQAVQEQIGFRQRDPITGGP